MPAAARIGVGSKPVASRCEPAIRCGAAGRCNLMATNALDCEIGISYLKALVMSSAMISYGARRHSGAAGILWIRSVEGGAGV